MKRTLTTRRHLALALTLMGGLTLLSAGSLAHGGDPAKKNTYASNPRSREEFPGLAANGRTDSAKALTFNTERNRALLNSPRFREEHPEALRGKVIHIVASPTVPKAFACDSAALTNPRVREEFPALSRR